jgi:alkanesulfonate monooxygenase SsuD/methylene tetrahydromethanopterin reductase-like flavin-dependent oxidoreductase (luciferase family)
MYGMKFGVFDHLDRNELPLRDYYEARLEIVEAYERFGFHAYHIAEHHSTPLGMAPSPSVFLAAVAQRTRCLRFGPLVYALPLYHPLRMIEEICMLDQISRGRLEIGFGRGSSPTEIAYYGERPEDAQKIYAEALEVILEGLAARTLTFHGQFFDFNDVPMELEPYQKPHPPVWYGVHAPESAARAARSAFQVVALDAAPAIRPAFDSFRAAWRQAWGAKPLPLMGLGRFIVVAPTDAAALAIARRAYPVWHASFTHLVRKHKRVNAHPRPPTFDELMQIGQGVAGAPATVAAFLRDQIEQTGANYIVGQFAFGDVSLAEALQSIELFAREVMPQFESHVADRAAI